MLSSLLQELLDFCKSLSFWIIVLFCLCKINLDVLRGLKISEVFDEIRIMFEHAKLDDIVDKIPRVYHAQQLLWLNAAPLQLAQYQLGRIRPLLARFIFGEDQGHEKEPDTMWEEDVGLGCHKDQVDEVVGILYVSLDIDRTELWNVKLKIISNLCAEIRVDPAVFKFLDCATFVSVQLEEAPHWIIVIGSAKKQIVFPLIKKTV